MLNGRVLFSGFVALTVVLYMALPYICQGTHELSRGQTSQSTAHSGALLCEVYKSTWNKSSDFTLNAVHGNEKIILYGKYLSEECIKNLQSSEYIYLKSKYTVPNENGNFYSFDMYKYIKAKGIDFVTYPYDDDLEFVKEISGSRQLHSLMYYSAVIRLKIENALRASMSDDSASISMSIMTGDTADMTEEDKSAFQKSGMSHLMAVSGAHVAFVTKPVSKLLLKVKIRKNGLVKKALLLLPFVFAIAFISGFSASIIRAALMSSYGIFAKVVNRKADNINALGFAGVISLLINPFCIYDIGFILSYVACLSIYLIMPKFSGILKKSDVVNNKKLLKSVSESFCMGIAVNLGMFPIVINMFNGMSFSGLILNIFASPIAEYVCMTGYVISMLHIIGIPQPICIILSYPCEFMCKMLKLTARGGIISDIYSDGIVSSLSEIFGYRKCPSIPIVIVVLYYSVILLVFICNKEKQKKYAIISTAVMIPVFAMSVPAKTEFVFFDVGQGVSVLVKTRDGCCGLIDTGDGKTDVSSLLFKEGIGRLDFIVVSHGHSDHFGGLMKVLEEHTASNIFVPNSENDECINLFIKENPKLPIVKVEGNMRASIGKYVVLDMYCFENESENINNSSIIALISGDWGNTLLPGDIENQSEHNFVQMNSALRAIKENKTDLLCVPHHGSETSSTEVFLETVAPKYAIISVGKNNLYGHPSPDVMNRLKKYTSEENIFRTDKCGALRVEFNRFIDELFYKIFGDNGDSRIVWRQKRRKV